MTYTSLYNQVSNSSLNMHGFNQFNSEFKNEMCMRYIYIIFQLLNANK
jgi:hypothetical protein